MNVLRPQLLMPLAALALASACASSAPPARPQAAPAAAMLSAFPESNMGLARSDGADCFATAEHTVVCPARGMPLRAAPQAPSSREPQSVAQRALLKDVPECMRGDMLIPCDVASGSQAGAVAEDSP